jgi:hypothetical protein
LFEPTQLRMSWFVNKKHKHAGDRESLGNTLQR